MAKNFKLILGSASPHRRAILERIGYTCEVIEPNIDEKAIRHANPYVLVRQISEAKAEAVLAKLDSDTEDFVLLTADQIVLLDGKILEKPASLEQARDFLYQIADASAYATASAVVVHYRYFDDEGVVHDKRRVGIDRSAIIFKNLDFDLLEMILADPEKYNIFGRAGGMPIDHPDLKPYIQKIVGSIDGLFGLHIPLIAQLIQTVTRYIPQKSRHRRSSVSAS